MANFWQIVEHYGINFFSGGHNIDPQLIEGPLHEHPDVARVLGHYTIHYDLAIIPGSSSRR